MAAGTPQSIVSILNALGEPALLLEDGLVIAANQDAKALLGNLIEGRDVRIALRHPAALDAVLSGRDRAIDVVGIGAAERPWRISVKQVRGRQLLVRLSDRSAIVTAERMRTDFVANASHELRTPLATLIGYGETLAEPGPLDDDLRARFGQTIHREARRMQRIVDDLMSLSRIEAERYQAPSGTVDVGSVVAASTHHANEQAERSGCVLEVDIGDGDLTVVGDAAQLGQLTDNLIGNAIRYGCNQRECRIQVSVKRDSAGVVLTVRDYGDGIDSEHIPRLTERFYRVDAARSRESGGTGLGLAIVKHIAERHRAALLIQSERGKGTLVTITLPGA